MTPELVQEAITTGASGFYRLQERTIWGDGPVLGYFTTPYSSVALAAALARKRDTPFTPADVTPDMLRPELHVYATSQAVYGNKNRIANVKTVAVRPYQSKDRTAALQPARTEAGTDDVWNLMGAPANGRNMMAVFPLSPERGQRDQGRVRPARSGFVRDQGLHRPRRPFQPGQGAVTLRSAANLPRYGVAPGRRARRFSSASDAR